MTDDKFRDIFKALTGNNPFPWQWALYQRFATGDFPRSCNLPTGLGKTLVIAVWLIALAFNPKRVPRRLVYVVNRRTVVDQTTDEVVQLRKNLCIPELAELYEVLQQVCATPLRDEQSPLAVSTLRGQFADNREWSADPARPAVIAGTVDMIGSRLLFSGYGIGFKGRPLHAGFLGQDVLLVHDEAHLEPAFQDLLTVIEKEQRDCERTGSLPWPKLRVMELSATSRGSGDVFELTEGEKNGKVEEVRKRIEAKKTIKLHENSDERKLADEIAELTLKFDESGRTVLVFVRKVEDVEKITTKLPAARTKRLTGTLRGLERDRLAESEIFRRFLPKAAPGNETVYLVCTSAGEVGVNISADHLVCDLSTFDSMAQRFGRVNRFGDCHDTEIHVVHSTAFDETNDLDRRRKKTLELVGELNGDGSPKALGGLDPEDRLAAFAPAPTILRTSDILFDAWSLTTIHGKLPGRPPVEPYLHGVSDWEPPETHVAWRLDVELLSTLFTPKNIEDFLSDYPLKPHELLRDRSDRVLKQLRKLPAGENHVWLVSGDGSVEIITFAEAIDRGEGAIEYMTILLPPSVGGLRDGFLDGNSANAADVADEWFDDPTRTMHRRQRVWDDEQPQPSMRRICQIDTSPELDDEADATATTGRRFWNWYVRPRSADDDSSRTSPHAVAWQSHTDDVTRNAERIAAALDLGTDLRTALVLAARCHDLGKIRDLWQRSIGNTNFLVPLAKSGGTTRHLDLNGYRHEFGSLMDVLSDDHELAKPLAQQDGEFRDVVLHLVAAHHGRGRPHFPADEVFDPERLQADADRIGTEVPERFARLQRKYGRWGLAYLESLLRAADIEASAFPSPTKDHS